MKKLSLFSLLGLLAFVAMPIYAQEEEYVPENEDVVYGAEVSDEMAYDNELDYSVEETEDVSELFNFNEEEFENTFNSLDEDQKGVVALTGLAGLFAGLGIAAWIISLAWAVLSIIAMWRIFKRAGEAGWKSIIPVYNLYIMYKIVGMKKWFWYSLIVPFVLGFIAGLLPESAETIGTILTSAAGLFCGIVAIVATFRLPRRFGWNVFASILYVLFTAICVLVLGFGNYKYEGKSE